MIDLFLVFAIGSLLALIAGGGWASLLACASSNWVSWAFWMFAIGIAIESLAWSWALGLGGGIWAAIALFGVASCSGWIAAVRKRGGLKTFREMPIGLQRLDVGVLVAIAALMVAPGLTTLGSTTLAYRIGPDGLGNAVAAEALANGKTLSALESDIVSATGASNIDSAIDQNSHLLYSAASLRTQVRTEFIVAGLRWGYSGAAAIPLRFLGNARIWAIVTLLPVLAAMFAALGIIALLRAANVRAWKRAAAIVLSIIGVTLLNGYREGGLSQLWVVPCIVAFAWAVLDEGSDRKTRMWMGAIASAGLLPAYSDAAFLLAAILALQIVVGLLLRDRPRAFEHCWLGLGALGGVVATGPYLLRFIAYVPKRLKDSQAGGWLMPRWTSPSETIGLFNSYNERYVTATVPRSGLLQVAVTLSDLALVGLSLLAIALVVRQRAASLLIATTFMIAFFYVKARYVDNVTNYQYFKAAGISQPLLGLSLVLVWHSAEHLSRRALRRSFAGITAYAGAACATSAVVYCATFISQDSTVDQDLVSASAKQTTRDLVDSRNVVGPSRSPSDFMETATLIPLLDLHWYGRPAYDVPQRLVGRESNPLSLLIFRKDCEDWKCIEGVRSDAVHEMGPTLRLVDLAPNSLALAGPDGTALTKLPTTISSLSQNIGGPPIGSNFLPA